MFKKLLSYIVIFGNYVENTFRLINIFVSYMCMMIIPAFVLYHLYFENFVAMFCYISAEGFFIFLNSVLNNNENNQYTLKRRGNF